MDASTIILIGSICTAIAAIIGFGYKYGGMLVSKLVKYGVEKMDENDLTRNQHFKKIVANQNAIADSVARLAGALEMNTMMTLRLEIKDLIRNSPEQRRAIEAAVSDYHEVHGDSYIDAVYEAWKDEYLKAQAKKEIKHKGGK